MKAFRWNHEKNDRLKRERAISFEEAVLAIERGGVIDVLEHPNAARYPGQRIMVVAIEGYAWLIPFVEQPDHFFLKTMIPSRKATRDYGLKGA